MTVRKRASPHRDKRRSSHVPGQLFGYSLQYIRAVRLLIDAPLACKISLEVIDDVGVQREDGSALASQTKTGLTSNPLADKSIEFWKTLANWCDAAANGDVDPGNTIFELYTLRPKPGKVVTLLKDARSDEEVQRAIDHLNKMVSDTKIKTHKVAGSIAAHVERVVATDHTILKQLIRNFQISPTSRNPLADLRDIVSTKWIRPESVEIIVEHAHGWVKEQFDNLLLQGRPAVIVSSDFHREMVTFSQRCDFRLIVGDLGGLPAQEDVAAEKSRTYVRQLEIISLDEESTLAAINEYLRAVVARTKLSEDGIVHEDSFVEYQEALLSFWRNKRRHTALTYRQHSHEELGQLLLSECCMHQQKLQGLELPAYFTPGSYHALADETSLGWHPEYQERLQR